MINAHAHIFTVKDVPVDFLKDAPIPAWAGKFLVRRLQSGGLIAKMAKALVGKTEEGKKYKAFINIGSQKTMTEVFNTLRYDNDYPDGSKFVALPMQFEMMGAGECEVHSYADQITEIIETKSENLYDLFPFYAIDPRMGNTPAEVAEFVKKHLTMAIPYEKDAKGIDIFGRVFYGIKIYPSLGFFPYDPLLKDTYQYAQENNLPIMTHCSRGGICYSGKRSNIPNIYDPQTMRRIDPCLLDYTSSDPCAPNYKEPKYSYPDIDNDKIKNDAFCDFFLDPENYMDALSLFPHLKICFAHFGSDSEIATKLNITIKGETKPACGSPRNDTWFDKLLALLKREEYPNLFTDISYTLHIPEFRKLVKDEIEKDLNQHGTNDLDKRLISKILFGTDFFMAYREKDVTEKVLVNAARIDFLNIVQKDHPRIHSLGIGKLWEYLTVTNPKRYLNSKFARF